MDDKPEALRLADALQQQAVWEGHYGASYLGDLLPQAAAELRRLHEEVETWKGLYHRAINEAGGLTNYVEDRPELFSAEKRLTKIQEEARAAIAKATGEQA
jgi:hypothetical protein